MREILFRGKPKYKSDIEFVRPDVIKDDGFIYGSLVVENGKYFICTFASCSHNTFVNNAIATMFEVIPSTVGQYTGLPDKKGYKIFEGDIVKYQLDPPITSFRNFLDKRPRIRTGKIFFSAFRSSFSVTVGKNGNDSVNDDLYMYAQNGNVVEVIGNIHDNPELLKGNENGTQA